MHGTHGLVVLIIQDGLTQNLESGESLFGVRVQHLADEVLGPWRDGRPGIAGEVDVAAQDRVEDAVFRFGPKRRHTGEKDVQHHTHAPNINFRAVSPLQHLRGNVIRASNDVLKYFPYI